MIQQQETLHTATFIKKLFKILNTTIYNEIITWDKDGKSIKINNFNSLQKHILKIEFRHNNYKSFVRQLNMYGFRKLKKSTHEIIFFFHPLFSKNSEQNLHLIQRTQTLKSCQSQRRILSDSYQEYLQQKRKILLQIDQEQQKHILNKNINSKVDEISSPIDSNQLSKYQKRKDKKQNKINQRNSVKSQLLNLRQTKYLDSVQRYFNPLQTFSTLKRKEETTERKQDYQLNQTQNKNQILNKSQVFSLIPQQQKEEKNKNVMQAPNYSIKGQIYISPSYQITPLNHQPTYQIYPSIIVQQTVDTQLLYQPEVFQSSQSIWVPSSPYFVFK